MMMMTSKLHHSTKQTDTNPSRRREPSHIPKMATGSATRTGVTAVSRLLTVALVLLALSAAAKAQSSDRPTACPGRCVCNPRNVRCIGSQVGLKVVPTGIPYDTEYLTISQTSIERIEKDDFTGHENIIVFYLQDNQINYIHPLALRNMYKLRTLNLERNRLTTLGTSGLLFQHLPSLNTLVLISNDISYMSRYTFLSTVATSTKLEVKMYENQVDCNCEVLAFKNWQDGLEGDRLAVTFLNCANDPQNREYSILPSTSFGNCRVRECARGAKGNDSKELEIESEAHGSGANQTCIEDITSVNGIRCHLEAISNIRLNGLGHRNIGAGNGRNRRRSGRNASLEIDETGSGEIRRTNTTTEATAEDSVGENEDDRDELLESLLEDPGRNSLFSHEEGLNGASSFRSTTTTATPATAPQSDEDEGDEIDVGSQECGTSIDVFGSTVTCPACSGERTNHACNLQPSETCSGREKVCLRTVTWNETAKAMSVSSRCERYTSCLEREARNIDRCGIGYQPSGDVECEFCCLGPTCQEDTIGGRTHDLTLYLTYTRFSGPFESYMDDPSSSRYKSEVNRTTTGVRTALKNVKSGVDVYLHNFASHSRLEHNVSLRIEITAFTTDTRQYVLEQVEQTMGYDLFNPFGFLAGESVVPTSILLSSHATSSGPSGKTTISPVNLYCPAETTSSTKGNFTWPRTLASRSHMEACPYQDPNAPSLVYAMRFCFLRSINSSAYWGSVRDSDCPEKTVVIDDVTKIDVTPDNAADVSAKVTRLTSSITGSGGQGEGQSWSPVAVDQVVGVLEDLARPGNLEQDGVVDNLVESISNLIDIDVDIMRSAQQRGETSRRIVELCDSVSERAPLVNGRMTVVHRNIAIAAQEISASEKQDVTLNAGSEADGDKGLDGSEIGVALTDKYKESSTADTNLVLPTAALVRAMTTEQKSKLGRAAFVVHRSDKLFVNPNSTHVETMQDPDASLAENSNTYRQVSDGADVKDRDDEDNHVDGDSDGDGQKKQTGRYVVKVNSLIISATIPGVKVHDLSENVTMTFQHESDNATNPRCAFWDQDVNDWSSEGCGVVSSEPGFTQCGCNHLTNFALLMDVYQEGSGLSSLDREILSYISYIGCGVSLAALLLTLVTYALFRKLRRDNPSKILINLCLALLFSNLVYLVGMHDYSFDNSTACKVVAVLLHYFLMASLTWMAVEAFYMYLALILVFKTYFTNFLLKCSLVGWGIPLVIVVVTLAIDTTSNYGFINTGMCWLRNPAFYAAFVGPVCLILLVNFIAFGLVIKQLSSMSSSKLNKTDRNSTVQRLRGAVGVVILLGLTWIFAVFAIGEASKVFYYLFAIFNSLQGLFIFIFYCLLKKDAVTAWKRVLPCFDEYGETSKSSSNSRAASQAATQQYTVKHRPSSATSTLHGTSSTGTASTSLAGDSRKNSLSNMLDTNGHIYNTIEDGQQVYTNPGFQNAVYTNSPPPTSPTTPGQDPPAYSLANAPSGDGSAYAYAQPQWGRGITNNRNSQGGGGTPNSLNPSSSSRPRSAGTSTVSSYATRQQQHQPFYSPPFSYQARQGVTGNPRFRSAEGEVDTSHTARVRDVKLKFERTPSTTSS